MTVSSLSGRSVELLKGVPTHCPPQMHDELIARGVVPAEEMPEPEVAEGPQEPTDPVARRAAIFASFKKLSLRAKREEFTASGVPHLAVLAMDLGWPMVAKERDAMWVEFNQTTAE